MLIQIEEFEHRKKTLGDQFREINRQLAAAGVGRLMKVNENDTGLAWKGTLMLELNGDERYVKVDLTNLKILKVYEKQND